MKKPFDPEAGTEPHIRSIPEEDASDGRLAEQLRGELGKLDEWLPVHTPHIVWFEQMVVQHKRELRRRLIRDLLLFWAAALAILAVVLGVVLQNLAVFAAVQAVVLAAAVFTWMRLERKRVNRT
jgi:Flp pilus assembly protein TadB